MRLELRHAKDMPDGMRRNKKRLVVHNHSKSDSSEYEVHVCVTSILDGDSGFPREKRVTYPRSQMMVGK